MVQANELNPFSPVVWIPNCIAMVNRDSRRYVLGDNFNRHSPAMMFKCFSSLIHINCGAALDLLRHVSMNIVGAVGHFAFPYMTGIAQGNNEDGF